MASTFLLLLLAAFTGDSGCTILFFSTGWCQPCQQMQPAIEQLRGSGWDIRNIDTDRQRPVAEQFQVENLPTLVILSDGREVDRIVGTASHAQIEKRIARAAARTSSASATPASLVLNGSSSDSNSNTSSSQAPRTAPFQTQQAAGNQPIVRGQSPGFSPIPRGVANTLAGANMALGNGVSKLAAGRNWQPTLTRDQAIDRAAKATVRVRVDEGNTLAYGTGTIIHVRGDEALVLTCGHLFRDMRPGTRLSVDLFAGTPQEINATADLIDFSAEDVDIGLISMRIPVMIEPVEILPRGAELQMGQTVFSFGCDHGANPTRRDTRISRVNRYIGAANVEIVGAPAVGRSGGGLFDDYGRLLAVCNAANASEDEGIYAAAEVVYGQLERLQLTELFDAQGEQLAHSGGTTSPSTPSLAAQSAVFTKGPGLGHSNQQLAQPEWPDASAVLDEVALSNSGETAPAALQASQVICIVRDAQGNDRMVTIHAPSAELLERIRIDSVQ